MNIYFIFLLLIILFVICTKIYQRYAFNRKYNPLLIKRGLVIKGYSNQKSDKYLHVMTKDEILNGGHKLHSLPVSLNGHKKWSINFWMKPENLTGNFEDGSDARQEHLLEWGKSVYILYEPLRNELQLVVNTVVTNSQHYQQFRFSNAVGIQKWNMVTISFDNRNVDLFVNGKLLRSIVLYNVPIFDENKWTTCSQVSFTGKLTAMRFFYTNLNESDVKYIYSQSNPITPIDSRLWWFWKKSYISF